jgi:coenzyme F420-reducing hydrogenase delta subunit
MSKVLCLKKFMKNRSVKIYIYYCSNSIDASQLSELVVRDTQYAIRKSSCEPRVTFQLVSLPCSGKIDIPYLIKAFETGADGVVLITCPQGECRSLEGNLRARKRSQAVESFLEEIGIEKGRMAFIMTENGHIENAIREIDSFIDRIKKTIDQRPKSDVLSLKSN